MPRPLLVLFLSILLPAVTACASTGSARPGVSGAIISWSDIDARSALSAGSAFEVVSSLRPRWLRTRGVSSFAVPGSSFPVVFVDHARYGTPESLRQVRARHVESIEFLSAREATTRHGTGFPAGIIQVRTRTGG